MKSCVEGGRKRKKRSRGGGALLSFIRRDVQLTKLGKFAVLKGSVGGNEAWP